MAAKRTVENTLSRLQPAFNWLFELFQRHAGLMAVLAFVSGIASYVLIDRKESIAQFIAAFMLVSWVVLVADNWLTTTLERRFGWRLSPLVVRFLTQLVHQESLFFALPFFLAVTNWDHGQAVFTSVLLLCALISIIDPLYYKHLATRYALFVAFHTLALFVVMLVVLPLLLQLTTQQSLIAAIIAALVFSLPSLDRILPPARWWRLPLLLTMLAVMALVLWHLRSWIPPAGMRLSEITISHQVDATQRSAGSNITELDVTELQQGLFAWTAVSAPRGLKEKIHHVWLLNGKEVDRIVLDITGGRDAGYRAWSHKLVFPPYPAGKWQVQVVTESGRLIGLTRFTVTRGNNNKDND
ncbi:DUF5924 family protein [Arsukibacterium sp. UBA3155]|uniref:DUF5924 family protein n=1 Tax=Arsukibacterium sp. UBA3155 TaxID=1946058 RepID=UPI0025BDF17C|nr:DUF5924 family protein [Arsukibacterium sp. UBA3155]